MKDFLSLMATGELDEYARKNKVKVETPDDILALPYKLVQDQENDLIWYEEFRRVKKDLVQKVKDFADFFNEDSFSKRKLDEKVRKFIEDCFRTGQTIPAPDNPVDEWDL